MHNSYFIDRKPDLPLISIVSYTLFKRIYLPFTALFIIKCVLFGQRNNFLACFIHKTKVLGAVKKQPVVLLRHRQVTFLLKYTVAPIIGLLFLYFKFTRILQCEHHISLAYSRLTDK